MTWTDWSFATFCVVLIFRCWDLEWEVRKLRGRVQQLENLWKNLPE